MAITKELHVWMQNKRETWTEPEVINKWGQEQKGKRIVIEVSEKTTIPEMKIAVAEQLERFRKQLKYYYVVAVVEKEDGTFAYKTIVKKVVL
jgi:hypothetical protein